MRTRPGRLPATPPTIAPARLDVLVVDGPEPTRHGLGLLLKREPWVRRCVLAGDGGRAVAIARRLAPEVAVVDTTDLGPALAPLLAALRQAHPPVRFVLAARARTAVLAADLPGVAGVLPVEAGRDDVVRIVRAAGLEAAAATSAAAAFAAPATPPAPALGA
jgi:DNA-binding NarL/FixJ family response regulator